MRSLLWVFTIDGGTTFNTKKRWIPLKKKLMKSMTFTLNVCFVTGFALKKILRAISRALSQATFLRRWICTDRSLGTTNYISQTKCSFFRKVVFIYVSDDVSWGKKRLLPRVNEIWWIEPPPQNIFVFASKITLCVNVFCHQVKTGDLFFAEYLLEESDAPFSLPEQVWTFGQLWSLKNGSKSQADKTSSQGRDLAILSSCNHTILSYGTYGFWGGFLAGHGKGIRSESQVDSDCFRSRESFMSFSPVGEAKRQLNS